MSSSSLKQRQQMRRRASSVTKALKWVTPRPFVVSVLLLPTRVSHDHRRGLGECLTVHEDIAKLSGNMKRPYCWTLR